MKSTIVTASAGAEFVQPESRATLHASGQLQLVNQRSERGRGVSGYSVVTSRVTTSTITSRWAGLIAFGGAMLPGPTVPVSEGEGLPELKCSIAQRNHVGPGDESPVRAPALVVKRGFKEVRNSPNSLGEEPRPLAAERLEHVREMADVQLVSGIVTVEYDPRHLGKCDLRAIVPHRGVFVGKLARRVRGFFCRELKS